MTVDMLQIAAAFWVGLLVGCALARPRRRWPTWYRPTKGPENPIPPGYRKREVQP